MHNQEVNIKEIINTNLAVSSDQGNKVFKVISTNVNRKVRSIVDFSGLEILTTSFLNTSIGNLYSTANKKTLNKYIILRKKGMSGSKINKIRLVMDNANKRLSASEADREIFSND